MKSPCLLFTAPFSVEVSETEITSPSAHQILMETHFSCISPGTELRCLAGRQNGAPAFPFIPGYAMAGVVIEAGSESGYKQGDRVFASGTEESLHSRCWGGHCSHALLDANHAIPVPAGVSLRAASTAKLAAIAYHGLLLSKPKPHESVAIIGLGPIGRFSAALHTITGAKVVATDLSQNRRQSAQNDGIQTVDPQADLNQAFKTHFTSGADIIVDATGAAPVLAEAARLGRVPQLGVSNTPPVRLLVQGSYANNPPLPYDTAFARELQILIPRDCCPDDIVAVLQLMERGLLKPESFINPLDKAELAAEAYRQLQESPDRNLTHTIQWKKNI